jgi:ribosome-associated protein
MSDMLRITPDIRILETELTERFVRASGPGGQNVNKVASAVQLRFDVRASTSLPEDVRARLLRLAACRLNQRGELVIEARRYRSQERNRIDARQRLVRWIERAAYPPKPRRPTRPPAAAKRRRLETKKARGRTKRLRKPPNEG